jgi:predicted RecB family nuclease
MPVYLDVEGLPDRDVYYLIGLRWSAAQGTVQRSLWAPSRADEKGIWTEFLDILSALENPVLLHYGSYETVFLGIRLTAFIRAVFTIMRSRNVSESTFAAFC